MISKYFAWLLVATLNVLLFTSCLGSSDRDIEYSPDAQIYAFSLTSRADTLNLLNTTAFTIDQVNGQIFNKEPLPYQFHVDSVMLSISSSSVYSSFFQVSLTVSSDFGDSTYLWNSSDSIAINRLKRITTTAQDGSNTKQYLFQLNIYQQDPYILSWEKKNDLLSTPPTEQKTILFTDRFITYYKTASTLGATSSTNGDTWTQAPNLQGLPPSVRLNSLVPWNDRVYILDEEGGIYESSNGIEWTKISTNYSIQTLYGVLPSVSGGGILMAVNNNETLYFALTDDFLEIQLMNPVPEEIPLWDFTATSVENPDSYATKYIVLTDGIKNDNNRNNEVWILQEKDDAITYISIKPAMPVQGSSLFYYDNLLYLMTIEEGKNLFLFSNSFGLDWEAAGENQAFPVASEFTPRTNASVVTDDSNNIWIFGGISAQTPQTRLIDVWRGSLNKFLMD